MKRTYRIHPADYAIGDSERLYERMAAKGWVLEKRGITLSRFRREAAYPQYPQMTCTGGAACAAAPAPAENFPPGLYFFLLLPY